MSGPNPSEMAERHGRALAELAELNLSAVQILHGRLEAAETPADAAGLGLAIQRVSRSVRQTLLLEAKLAREAAAGDRETARAEAAEAEKAAQALTLQRRSRVEREVMRAINEHAESAEQAEALMSEMAFCLNGWVNGHDWARRSLDELVADFCHDLGIPAFWEEAVRPGEEDEEPPPGALDDLSDDDDDDDDNDNDNEDEDGAAAAEAEPAPPPSPPPPPARSHPYEGWVMAPHGGWMPPPADSS